MKDTSHLHALAKDKPRIGLVEGETGNNSLSGALCRILSVPKKDEYKVGDRIQISLNNQIMDAVIRAVIDYHCRETQRSGL
jgi:hypothetical protein